MRRVVILGAGGFAQELYGWCKDCDYEVVGFFDEQREGVLMGLPVSQELPSRPCLFVPGVGHPPIKKKFWSLARDKNMQAVHCIVHPSVIFGECNIVHEGAVLCPGVIVTCGVTVGKGALLNLAVTVGHNCDIGEFATISPGANISGEVTIGASAYIGTNACIREGVTVGEGAVVGMGAVVVKDVPPYTVVMGNPAREKNERKSF